MSSLINLATATLLAVSPVLSEPKQVERPENVLYEQVNYLENNIKATSYIYIEDDQIYNYGIYITDNKLIDLNIQLRSDNSSSVFDRGVYVASEISFEFPFDSNEFEIFKNGYYQFDNVLTIETEKSDNSLNYTYVFPFFNKNDQLVYEETWSDTIQVSQEYVDYYLDDDYKVLLDLNLLDISIFNVYLNRYYLNLEGPGIIDNTFGIVGNTIQEYVSVVVDLFSQVVALFYAERKLTILGVLMVFAFGIGVVKFGFNMMKTLLRL